MWYHFNHHHPTSRFQSHGRNLRNSSNLSQYPMKTSHFRKSPVIYFVSLLNKTQTLFRSSVCFILTILFFVFRCIVSGCPWAYWRMLMYTLVPWPAYTVIALVHWPTNCAVDDGWPHLELIFINLQGGWVGLWRWALFILGLGRSVCIRVWEYVQGCLCDLCFCAIIVFIWVFQCVLAGKAFFSVILNFKSYCHHQRYPNTGSWIKCDTDFLLKK